MHLLCYKSTRITFLYYTKKNVLNTALLKYLKSHVIIFKSSEKKLKKTTQIFM